MIVAVFLPAVKSEMITSAHPLMTSELYDIFSTMTVIFPEASDGPENVNTSSSPTFMLLIVVANEGLILFTLKLTFLESAI